MMEIEKAFAKKDLSSIKGAPYELLAKQLVQYQNFKTISAIEKIDGMNLYTQSTLFKMIGDASTYLRTGEAGPSSRLPRHMIPLLDEAKKKYTPLTPKKSEERQVKGAYKPRVKKTPEAPVVTEEPVVTVVQKCIARFLYAVKVEEEYFTFKTEAERNAFIKACDFFGKEYKKLQLTIDD